MDVPWSAAHQKSDFKKSDRLDTEEGFMGGFSSPELKNTSLVASHAWQSESEKQFMKSAKGKCEDANKSKVKVPKLMKTMKPENPKKIVKQNSKDSVVLVGYKCLKTAATDDISKYFEGIPSCNQKEGLDITVAKPAFEAKNIMRQISQKDYRSLSPRTEQIATKPEGNQESQCGFVISQCANSITFHNIPQSVGLDTHENSNLTLRSTAEDSVGSSGVTKIEVKPYCRNMHRGEKVFVHIGSRTDVPQSKVCEGNLQQPTFQSSESEKKPKSEEELFLEKEVLQEADFRPDQDSSGKVTANQSTLSTKETPVTVVSGDVLKLPDISVTYASSRFSDSGIESEPSSFAMHPGAEVAFETPQGQSTCSSERMFPQLLIKPDCNIKNPIESHCTESTSAVSEIQSSLTSINSLPSDDDLSPDENSNISLVPECQLSDSKTILDLGAIDLTKCDDNEESGVVVPHCVECSEEPDNETTFLPSLPSNIKTPLTLVLDEDTCTNVKIHNPQLNIETICKDAQRLERDVHSVEKSNETPSGIVYLGESCVISGSVSTSAESIVEKPVDADLNESLEEKQIAVKLTTTENDNLTSMNVLSSEGSTDMLKQGLVENYFGYQSNVDISNIYSVVSNNPVSPQRGTICTISPENEEEEEEEEEQNQDMVENGYFEETDDSNLYGATNDLEENFGLTDERALRTERMTSDPFGNATSMAPLCPPGSLTFPSTLKGYPCNVLWSSKDKSNAVLKHSCSMSCSMSCSTTSSVPWYEFFPKPQILA